jgi:ABC-type glycerol-3-phosphate transport system permease component
MSDVAKSNPAKGALGQSGASPGRLAPGRAAVHLLVVVLCLLTLFPLLWMLSTAFKAPQEVFSAGFSFVPENPTLGNFAEAFRTRPVGAWFLNSVLIAVAVTAGKLAISIPAAYAFSRFRFRGRNVLFGLVVGTMIVPDAITIVPNYVLVSSLDWLNTPQGVIVPSIAFTGFYVFLLRQAMLSIPREILDAARVDGASSWTILWRIVLPMVHPAVAVVTVLSFLHAWNLYLWPLLVLQDPDAKTLAVGIEYFAATQEGLQEWGPMMAAATLAILPPLLLFFLAQKRIISAFVESGVKG